MTLIVWDIGMKKKKEEQKIKFIVDHFSLRFVNLSLG